MLDFFFFFKEIRPKIQYSEGLIGFVCINSQKVLVFFIDQNKQYYLYYNLLQALLPTLSITQKV